MARKSARLRRWIKERREQDREHNARSRILQRKKEADHFGGLPH